MSRLYTLRPEPERPLEPKPWPAPPVCPVCNEEADTLYVGRNGDVVGCDCCVIELDIYEGGELGGITH